MKIPFTAKMKYILYSITLCCFYTGCVNQHKYTTNNKLIINELNYHKDHLYGATMQIIRGLPNNGRKTEQLLTLSSPESIKKLMHLINDIYSMAKMESENDFKHHDHQIVDCLSMGPYYLYFLLNDKSGKNILSIGLIWVNNDFTILISGDTVPGRTESRYISINKIPALHKSIKSLLQEYGVAKYPHLAPPLEMRDLLKEKYHMRDQDF